MNAGAAGAGAANVALMIHAARIISCGRVALLIFRSMFRHTWRDNVIHNVINNVIHGGITSVSPRIQQPCGMQSFSMHACTPPASTYRHVFRLRRPGFVINVLASFVLAGNDHVQRGFQRPRCCGFALLCHSR